MSDFKVGDKVRFAKRTMARRNYGNVVMEIVSIKGMEHIVKNDSIEYAAHSYEIELAEIEKQKADEGR